MMTCCLLGFTSPPKSYPPRTKRPLVPLVPPPSDLEERARTAHRVGIAMITGRRRVVRLESIGHNLLVSVGVAQGSEGDAYVHDTSTFVFPAVGWLSMQ